MKMNEALHLFRIFKSNRKIKLKKLDLKDAVQVKI
ncbi:hypothetical protein AF74_02045 [Aliarcobacter butzleri L349]|nr:hypothetical protein AF74_02045 [Aliarcobacter butzleri L349]